MTRLMTGRTVKVTRKIASAIAHSPSSLPRNSVCHSSIQPDICPPFGLNLTGFAAAPLFVGVRAAAHAELAQLAGEGVASPAEEPRRVLAMSLGAAQCGADQHALELRLRRIEERRPAVARVALGPVGERGSPVGFLRCGRSGAGHLRG